MFRITEDPSSRSLVQCMAKNYKKDSIASADMDLVSSYTVNYTHAQWSECATITPILSMSTDTIESFL